MCMCECVCVGVYAVNCALVGTFSRGAVYLVEGKFLLLWYFSLTVVYNFWCALYTNDYNFIHLFFFLIFQFRFTVDLYTLLGGFCETILFLLRLLNIYFEFTVLVRLLVRNYWRFYFVHNFVVSALYFSAVHLLVKFLN